ncbi:hypothetical protein FJY90_00275 [Candidatus Gottesmanbacteria bacterium]|nr:hypothetical protein [Candidatus Gottesmanbacteria bacterium]
MPKKTKKQKVLAELRRKLSAVSTISPRQDIKSAEFVKSQNSTIQSTVSVSSPLTFTYNNQGVATGKKASIVPDYSYVTRDLIKITIFTLFTIIFQYVLYFLLRRG